MLADCVAFDGGVGFSLACVLALISGCCLTFCGFAGMYISQSANVLRFCLLLLCYLFDLVGLLCVDGLLGVCLSVCCLGHCL